jgi:hypothetical protein
VLFLTEVFVARAAGAHQTWRHADLRFESPSEPLKVSRKEADARAVLRGTVQHEVLEGERAAVVGFRRYAICNQRYAPSGFALSAFGFELSSPPSRLMMYR